MSVSSAPAPARPVRRGSVPAVAVSVLVVVASIVGLLLGGSFGGSETPAVRPTTAPRSIAHDGLRVQLPSGWARGNVATVAGFVRPLRLRNGDDGLRASVERLPATSATLLPAAFLQTLKSAPEWPQLATLAGGRRAWRYRFPGQDGSMTLFYAAPTTSGVATIACTSPIDPSVPRACDALAAAVTVPGARPLALSTRTAFFTRIPAVATELRAARIKGVEELGAATRSSAQALAADGLARAHRAAGAALTPLTTAADGLPSATVGALTATATAYTALATAARARSPRPYAEATRAVTSSDAALRRTMTSVTAATEAATRVASTSAATTKPAASRPAETKPATQSKPAASKPVATSATETKPAAATAKAKPPAAALAAKPKAKPGAQGADLTLVLLALLGVFGVVFIVRETVRVVQSSRPEPE